MPKGNIDEMYALPIWHKREKAALNTRPVYYTESADGKSARIDLIEFSKGFQEYCEYLQSGMTHFDIVHEGCIIGTFRQASHRSQDTCTAHVSGVGKASLRDRFITLSKAGQEVVLSYKNQAVGVFAPAVR
ncbi:MAG: hypothetical protein RBR86_01945 [Pseudobdellovibrionaceae bacterium]|jgi:hypothetical protein|nr:hypothetical protein [Pseudobdellovibrionaceae bacterium]